MKRNEIFYENETKKMNTFLTARRTNGGENNVIWNHQNDRLNDFNEQMLSFACNYFNGLDLKVKPCCECMNINSMQ